MPRVGCPAFRPERPDLQRALNAKQAPLPIIFITGHGDIPTGVKAMQEGAVDFLPKPVMDTALLDAIPRTSLTEPFQHRIGVLDQSPIYGGLAIG